MANRYFEDHKKVQTIGKRTLAYARDRWHEQQEELFPKRDDYDSDFAYECAVDEWYRYSGDSEFVYHVNGHHMVYSQDGRLMFVLEPWSEIS